MTTKNLVQIRSETPLTPEDDDLLYAVRGSTDGAYEWAATLEAIATQGGFVKADGTVPLTANWDVGAFTVRGTQFISDIADGTAPLVVTSTTVVANLNVTSLQGMTPIDEDSMATDSATRLPTQQSVKAYVDGVGAGYATAAQGALADTALQPDDVGTAAAEDVGYFAAAAHTHEGTAIDSTGPVTDGYVLTADGAGGAAWEAIPTSAATTTDQRYTIDTGSTADSDPGAGLLKFNHATPSSATFIYIDDSTNDSIDLSTFFGQLGGAGFIKVQSSTDVGEWIIYKWSAVTDGTGYWKLAVTFSAGLGTFEDADNVLVSFDSSVTAANLQDTGLDADAAGFRGIPQNSQSGNYTCVAADAGKHIYHPSGAGSGDTFTVPANGSVAYEIGTTITFINMDTTNTLAIAITTDTMYLAGTGATGSRTLGTYGVATAIKLTSTTWVISGTDLS